MKLNRFAASACLMAVSSVAGAAEVGTLTVPNAQHVGRRGLAGNTVTNVVPAAGATIQAIQITGSLTSANVNAWAKNLRIQPNSTSLGSGPGTPGGQGYFQFTGTTTFTTESVSTLVLAPGGFSGTASLRLEAYSPDSESAVPGLDGTSNLTYSFRDALPNGGASFSGALVAGGPTFNRFVNFNADPFGPQVLDVSATVSIYSVTPFTVGTSGTYAIAIAGNFDTYLGLYAGAFNPASTLAGLVAANNEGVNVLRNASLGTADVDNVSTNTSRLDWSLTAGTQYYAVTTSFGSGTTGAFFGQIAGPGAVTVSAVPEPGAMTVVVVVGAGLARRRR